MYRPFLECLIYKQFGVFEAGKLAAHRPPVDFRFEFDANTIHDSNSFPYNRFLPERGIDTIIFRRLTWHHDLRVILEAFASVTPTYKL